MKCKYCDHEASQNGHCETHWMLGAFFQYELEGREWSHRDGNDSLISNYEKWMSNLSNEDIENIRTHYWLK